MSWFGDITDDWFGIDPPDTGTADQLAADQLKAAQATRKATEDALRRAQAAMVDPRDSESARKKAEAAMRRRQNEAVDVFAGGALGDAGVGYSALFGPA